MAKMRPKKDMRYYLRMFRHYDSLAKLVLSKGRWFLGRAEVQDYELARAWKKRRRPRAQSCFYNAQQFCIDNQGYQYFEGYMLIPGTPMEHAWIVWDDGKVVDFTLEAVLRKARRDHNLVDTTPPLYYGVEVPRAFIMQSLMEGTSGGPIAVNYFSSLRSRSKRS